jgi:molecular chaperone DnaK
MNNTERQLQEVGDKAPSELRSTLESHILNLRTALNGNDTPTEELSKLADELEQATYQLAEILYQQATASPAGAEAPAGDTHTQPHDDDTVDTEFKP